MTPKRPSPVARTASPESCASAARSIFIWKRRRRSRGSTNPAGSPCTPPRSIPLRRRSGGRGVWGCSRGDCRVPADGRRFRRQGNPGERLRRNRSTGRMEDGPAGAGTASAAARYGAHRQAPSLPGAVRMRIRRRRPSARRPRTPLFGRRMEPRPFRSGLGRAMFHIDNAYHIPALEVTGFVCKTHKTSQTAFRGFGGPQGMLVIEDILDRIARASAFRQRSCESATSIGKARRRIMANR